MTNYFLDDSHANLKDNPSELISALVEKKLSSDEIRDLISQLIDPNNAHDVMNLFEKAMSYTNTFFQMSNELYEQLPADSTIPVILNVISNSLQADRTAIYLNDPQRDELITRTSQGEWIPIRIPNDWGMVGTVFSSGKSEMVNSLNQDDPKSGKHIRNMLCVPLKSRSNKVIGVIEVCNREDGEFNRKDLSMLEAMAAQVSVTLRNGELHRQIKLAGEEHEKIRNIGQELTQELQLMPLIEKIINIAVDLLEADRSTIFLFDPQRDELWALEGKGDVAKKIRFPKDKGIAGAIFTSGKTLNISDAYSDSRFNPEFDQKIGYHTQSILGMPLTLSSGKCVGVIQMINKKGSSFSLTDEKRLEVLAEHASIAIDNAKLFKHI